MPEREPYPCRRCGGPRVLKTNDKNYSYVGCADPNCVATKPIVKKMEHHDGRQGARLPVKHATPAPSPTPAPAKKKNFLSDIADEFL
jgi:ssDNA-binding Zn-finger/Zn-ribbon topoisomerase 1